MKSLDHVNIDCKNSLDLTSNNVDGCIQERNRNRYLISASTDKNKEILQKCTERWNEIKNHVK